MKAKDKAALKKAAHGLRLRGGDYRRSCNVAFMITVLYVVLVALFIRRFIAEPVYVQGVSMNPMLYEGERIVIQKLAYMVSRPQRGDVVLCDYPGREENFIKRVVGLPGEVVEIYQGKVFINGNQLDESAYWNDIIDNDMPARRIKEGHVFVVGDNRNNSRDSRNDAVGDISYEHVKGKASVIVWPINAYRSVE